MSKIQLSKNFIKSSCKLALNEDLYPSGDITSELINKNRNSKTSYLIVTHYSRILKYLEVDQVHVVVNGKIAKSGSKELIEEVDSGGYTQY